LEKGLIKRPEAGGLWCYGALMVIIAAAAALRAWGYVGFVGLDDSEYSRYAFKMLNGTFEASNPVGPPMFPMRVALVFPAFLAFKLFGVNDISVGIYPFITSILGIMLIYVLTRHLFGTGAGLLAAAILAVFPLEYLNASRLLPDLPAALYAALGVTLIVILTDSETRKRSTLIAGGVIAGLSFGLSWLTKESIVYLVPFAVALLVISLRKDFKRNLQLWIGVAIGSFGVFFIEMAVYYAGTGDPMFRFHQMEKMYDQLGSGFFKEGSKFGWTEGESHTRAVLKRLLKTGPETIFLNAYLLYIPLLALLASIYALFWKDKRFLITGLWFISLVVMYNFGSSSTSSYTPLALLNRYLYPIIFPAIVLTAGLFDRLLIRGGGTGDGARRERLFWGLALLLFICLTTLPHLLYHARGARLPRGWAAEARQLSSVIKPSDSVYADRLSMISLEFYWGYPERMGTINFEGMGSTDGIKDGDYVLIHPRALKWLNDNAGMWLNEGSTYLRPSFVDDIPPGWIRAWSNDLTVLYKVNNQQKTASDG
jgi:4-amino-4-deoxy-L-arabinose transferase-like glycosyltransferase